MCAGVFVRYQSIQRTMATDRSENEESRSRSERTSLNNNSSETDSPPMANGE
jgi:hypothetical protein